MKRLIEALLAAALAALIASVVMSGAFTGIQRQLPLPDVTDAPPFIESEQPESPMPPEQPVSEEMARPEDELPSDDSSMETRGFDKWRRVLKAVGKVNVSGDLGHISKRYGSPGKLSELAGLVESLSNKH